MSPSRPEVMTAAFTGADQGQLIAPGATIGIMGGGQLGRMTALAAARLGYRCHIFCPDEDSPGSQVTSASTVAPYDDEAALQRFADAVDVVTFEFESIPRRAPEFLATRRPTRPKPFVLHICQQRLREKDFLALNGVPVTRYLPVPSREALDDAVRRLGLPAILKSAQFGYDGKGQVRLTAESNLDEAWTKMGGALGILEAEVDFALEASVIAARGIDGQIALYPPVENRHRHHILDETIAPADLKPETVESAERIVRNIVGGFELVGLLGVELFIAKSGEVLV